jgi:hypothetical protein
MSGRELFNWLAAQSSPPLVTVSGLSRDGRPSVFVAVLQSWSTAALTVEPMDGSSPADIPMPDGWHMAPDAAGALAFDGRGFTISGRIRITYLDDKDPFR